MLLAQNVIPKRRERSHLLTGLDKASVMEFARPLMIGTNIDQIANFGYPEK